MKKLVFISGCFFNQGCSWWFWCFKRTDFGERTEQRLCSVMAVCQTYSNPPVHHHRVHIQHEQDKLFMCQLPGNVWVKILNALLLQRSQVTLWLIFKCCFVNRVKTLSKQVNRTNGTSKASIYTQFIQPFLSRQLTGAVKMFFKFKWFNSITKWKWLQ